MNSGKPRSSKVQLSTLAVNASDLAGLRRAWQRRELVLFLGAGVSIPYGLPSWRDLVLELLFEQTKSTRRLGQLLPHYRRAVASWMTEYFDYDPLVLARMVERELRGGDGKTSAERQAREKVFLERLREHLYANYRKPTERTTLQAIGELIERSTTRSGVEAVVSFNFDDLLERTLSSRGVKVRSIVNGTRNGSAGLRVIHAHGYVPREGAISRDEIVFTEPDYHRLTESTFHWGLAEIVDRLRKSTVLFLGLSMSDPSLRRLLDASRNSKIPPHWQVQKRHEVRDQEEEQAMAAIDHRAREAAKILGKQFDGKTSVGVRRALNAVLKQADTYDRKVFQSMGVKTIWVDRFPQMTEVVDAIRTKGS